MHHALSTVKNHVDYVPSNTYISTTDETNEHRPI